MYVCMYVCMYVYMYVYVNCHELLQSFTIAFQLMVSNFVFNLM